MKYFLIYLLIINFIGFFAMLVDKQKAKRDKWRIPEKTLFLLAILGGSVGTILGMHLFHHKTRHWYFQLGMPLILLLQVVAYIFIKMKFS